VTFAANYDEVVGQLMDAGLRGRGVDDGLVVGRMQRCKVDGDQEKRGWYSLHEIRTDAGDTLIVGSYGVWRGLDNGAMKVQLRERELSADQRGVLRARFAEDRKRADQLRQLEADRAARRAQALWSKLSPSGDSEYLERKGVGAYGVRFSPKTGAAAVPACDAAGRIHGLQILRDKCTERQKAKQFWPAGMIKRGHFHLFGGSPVLLVLVAEGYATAASLHAATGHPVACAFVAGNLTPVCLALRKRYRGARILVCADDDSFTPGNPGITAASTAAVAVDGAWAAPQWSADSDLQRAARHAKGDKLTDFNDLQHLEGLGAVRAVIEGKLTVLRWAAAKPSAPVPPVEGAGPAALRPLDDIEDLINRYALVYGGKGLVFDFSEHQLVALSDMRDACRRRELHRAWQEHPERQIVRMTEVGFDPAGDDANIRCNLWAGWPTKPKAGSCERLIELLWYMTEREPARKELFDWMLRWLALPLQRPGAKLKTAIVIHGPQGTGKNMFFEAYMRVYGHYGRVIDQVAIEDKFNDWASRKLFLIADEVIARAELHHIKNRLKSFITGDWIRINAKNIAAYDERNHVNLVFLSNEAQPVVLDEDDRRHAVLWTPGKLDAEFYESVLAEIAAGGIEALHDHLLNIDLGDFNVGTLPPRTDAKNELVDISLDSTSRFFYALTTGEIPHVEVCPALSQDLYDLYRIWCQRTGARAAPAPRLLNQWKRRHGVEVARKRYIGPAGVQGPHGCVLLGATAPPDGQTESGWLGDSFQRFRDSCADYRGGLVHV